MEISQVEKFPRMMQFSWEFSGTNSRLNIEIPIFCPICGSEHIWKRGFDRTVEINPQNLYCHNCGKNFFPHTSKFFKDQTLDLITDIMESAIGRGHKVIDIATQYKVSPSVISELIEDFLEYISQVKDKARSYADAKGSKVIFMDEKFLRIGGKKYLLIIALNEKGEHLTYRLVMDRTAETVESILLEAINIGGIPDLIVTDGFTGYRKAIKLTGLSIVHVEHIHRPPYGRVIITRIENSEDEIKEISIGTTNDIFVNDGVNIGRVLVKTTKKN